ncbi:hypothetical protein BJ122_102266 [Rhodopseudomonas faecalis]|uniref:Uncharacterized protein n=1 Tax=Rhodopseudomonas faecalis TaxID=99655 RepID=A0A318TMF1_9BRAD|nr:hypothetical protein [Rhodopseudomonas faecalis]PYF05040.1 hypothetical protein BJ122_102266 [Rhodopseudomonas faecalis]
MEKKVQFRDYQEQQAADHTNLQDFTEQSLDHIVTDAVTASRRYSGFGVVKSAQAEVIVSGGRFYDQGGAVYNLATPTTQLLVSFLPVIARRIVTVSVSGVEADTDVETRDFLTNVDTGQTEPRAVATVRARNAVLAFTAGAENADPQPPAIPASNVAIANILLDPTQVVSITALTRNQVASTEGLDMRALALEAWRSIVQPRVDSLASDISALAKRVDMAGSNIHIVKLYQDLAQVKEKAGLPQAFSQYGADYFLWPDTARSDINNTQNLGFDAEVEMGVRFPSANATQFEISLFSANDANAAYSNGLLLPAYDSVVKLSTGDFYTDLALGQFGWQTYALEQKQMKVERLRYGGRYAVCSNGSQWQTASATGDAPYWLPNFSTYRSVAAVGNNGNYSHLIEYYDYWWHDSWAEPYWELKTVEHKISGAQVAQTFLNSSDMWATGLDFYVTSKAAAEDIWVTLCEVTGGQPDLSKTLAHVAYPHASIVAGWNTAQIPPTFLSKGGRYAVVLTTGANHKVGMTSGQSYLDGTFFYNTDGVYFLGDLTKDLMLRVRAAKFRAAQVTIEFGVINLDGGLRNIDITAQQIVPASTDLIYEIRANGSGAWQPLTKENLTALNGAPALCQFRARFNGTSDVQPGLRLPGSRVYVSRPKTAFRHIAAPEVLAAPSSNITVKYLLEGYDPTPHTFSGQLRVGGQYVSPATTTVTLVDASVMRYEVVCNYTLAAPTSTFSIVSVGTTNSPATVYHIAERVFWAL